MDPPDPEPVEAEKETWEEAPEPPVLPPLAREEDSDVAPPLDATGLQPWQSPSAVPSCVHTWNPVLSPPQAQATCAPGVHTVDGVPLPDVQPPDSVMHEMSVANHGARQWGVPMSNSRDATMGALCSPVATMNPAPQPAAQVVSGASPGSPTTGLLWLGRCLSCPRRCRITWRTILSKPLLDPQASARSPRWVGGRVRWDDVCLTFPVQHWTITACGSSFHC